MPFHTLSIWYFDKEESCHFTHSFNKYFLSTSFVPGTALGSGDTAVIKTDKKSLSSASLPLYDCTFN